MRKRPGPAPGRLRTHLAPQGKQRQVEGGEEASDPRHVGRGSPGDELMSRGPAGWSLCRLLLQHSVPSPGPPSCSLPQAVLPSRPPVTTAWSCPSRPGLSAAFPVAGRSLLHPVPGPWGLWPGRPHPSRLLLLAPWAHSWDPLSTRGARSLPVLTHPGAGLAPPIAKRKAPKRNAPDQPSPLAPPGPPASRHPPRGLSRSPGPPDLLHRQSSSPCSAHTAC